MAARSSGTGTGKGKMKGKMKGKGKGKGKGTTKSASKVPPTDQAKVAEKIERSFAKLGDWRGELLVELRRIIRDVDPEVVEDWKWMGTPVWSHDGMYALANPHKGKVKLTLMHGAQLPDPKKLFNAGLGGNKWRAIDFAEDYKLNKPALKALLRAAIAYNQKNAVPRSRGSRGSKLAATEPVLLSGDNPQIAKGDGDAPVQRYIAAIPGWKREVARALDALIVHTVPDVRKAVKWNSPFYGVEGQGWFLNLHCFSRYVKVAFFRGASLRPPPPGESKHKDVRYYHIHQGDEVDNEKLASWIRQAADLPGWMQ